MEQNPIYISHETLNNCPSTALIHLSFPLLFCLLALLQLLPTLHDPTLTFALPACRPSAYLCLQRSALGPVIDSSRLPRYGLLAPPLQLPPTPIERPVYYDRRAHVMAHNRGALREALARKTGDCPPCLLGL